MRQAVAHLKAAFGVSERRACFIIKADRKSVRYRSCRPPDTALREPNMSHLAKYKRLANRVTANTIVLGAELERAMQRVSRATDRS